MATSGSVDFSLNRNELIKAALRHIGVGVTGEAPSNEEVSDASVSLNLMLKAWMAEGIHLWKREELSIPLTDGKNTYTVGQQGSPDITAVAPLKVISAIREHTDGGVANMDQLSYDAWLSLPSKDTKVSSPTEFFFNPPKPSQDGQATFKVWPTPNATAASDPGTDRGRTDDLDIPPYYEEAAMYGLAYCSPVRA